jgi:hypothetical protein
VHSPKIKGDAGQFPLAALTIQRRADSISQRRGGFGPTNIDTGKP